MVYPKKTFVQFYVACFNHLHMAHMAALQGILYYLIKYGVVML